MKKLINDLQKVGNEKVVKELGGVIQGAGKEVDNLAKPIRESLLKRYPTLFTLFVTFGVVATFLGIEQLFLKIHFLEQHPEVILLIGVAILAFTGRLYKKLN